MPGDGANKIFSSHSQWLLKEFAWTPVSWKLTTWRSSWYLSFQHFCASFPKPREGILQTLPRRQWCSVGPVKADTVEQYGNWVMVTSNWLVHWNWFVSSYKLQELLHHPTWRTKLYGQYLTHITHSLFYYNQMGSRCSHVQSEILKKRGHNEEVGLLNAEPANLFQAYLRSGWQILSMKLGG